MNITLASWGPQRKPITQLLEEFDLTQEGIYLRGTVLSESATTVETSFLGKNARGIYLQFFGVDPTNENLMELIFRLTDQVQLLLTIDPGPPHIITTPRGLPVEDITDENVPPWLEVVCVVDKPTELAAALNGQWRKFRSTYADVWWHMPEGF